jgi:hypothetical protein
MGKAMDSNGREEGVATNSLPPDVQEWIDKTAAELRDALNDPVTRAEICALLTGEQEQRQRRLAELATELQGMELTMRLGNDDET